PYRRLGLLPSFACGFLFVGAIFAVLYRRSTSMRSIQDPWQVSEAEFPRTGGPSEKLRHLLNYAVLAPSDHNTQPWRFRLAHGSVDVFADRSRALPVVDPADRELVISCGAALYQLRLAIRYFGFADRVALFPDAQQP